MKLPLLPLALLAVSLTGWTVAAPTPRAAFLAEVARRPADPWPRGEGHVVLGVPGMPDHWKAYHEPGGSFSPGFATFGVSLWVVDDQGRLMTTSDALPLESLTQRWVWPEKGVWPALPDLPGVETATPYYTSTWQILGEGRYQLRLRTGAQPVWIMVRCAGPAGARIRSLKSAGGKLYVNDQWLLQLKGPGWKLDLQSPSGAAPDGAATAEKPFWPAEAPMGYARFLLLPAQDYWLTVETALMAPPNPLPSVSGRALLKVELPDPEFGACLDAQVAQILMGLVGNETRPGDPNNYPLNWLRDGAYTIVALARAGQLPVARELCLPFAGQDFFGGFGAEADAPGLALWALEEVAVRLEDPGFDAAIWPHVVRKVELIQEMLAATNAVRKPFTGPVVPAHTNNADLDLVCEAAQDGLVMGRMDWHQPVLFVNAVTYRGLVSAARLADQTQHATQAAEWRTQAQSLREAWNRALGKGWDVANDRTAGCGLHPTWVVQDRSAYRRILESRRAQTHDPAGQRRDRPVWTYFPVAEAHQWLLLGQPAKAWEDLRWFWNHEASPGLWTWWEGEGEENSYGRWEKAYGWARPPHVTPHYWTAAEMALLQLDMLVAVDESVSPPRLLIGPGVPAAWMDQTLRVEGMQTRLGEVGWEWRKGRLTVRRRGAEAEVVPGPAFPADLDLRIRD